MKLLLLTHSAKNQSKKRKGKVLSWPMVILLCLCLQLISSLSGFLVGQHTIDQQTSEQKVAEIHATPSNSTPTIAAPPLQSANPYDDTQQTLKLTQSLDILNRQIEQAEARLAHLDELAKALVHASGLVDEQLDFNQPPPSGGPHLLSPEEADHYSALSPTSIAKTILAANQNIKGILATIEQRANQFYVLSDIIKNQHLYQTLHIHSGPVTNGWLSSHYGYRNDPFTGRRAWHNGIDIASEQGADIISVSPGIVLRSGYAKGYGNLVEISHANGYTTRYAHCHQILVSAGELIKEGQTIATVGSTGRSTGPHVHFEVLVEGKSVDPKRYLKSNG